MLARRSIVLALAAMALPATAHAAAPTVQLGQLRAGTAILQAKPGKLSTLRRQLAPAAVFPRLGMVAVRGDAAILLRAARLPAVRYAHMDRRIRFFDHASTPLVYDGRQQALWSGGSDGRGVRVAIVDSGVDGTHADLQKRVARNVKIVADGATVECPTACTSDTSSGHGTHVAGIVAGDGTASDGYHTGVAPGADLVGYGVGDGDSILWALAAFDDILAHPELNIRAVNNSWGPLNNGSLRTDLTDSVPQATKKLHDAGVTVVFAAGNDGTASNEGRPPGASKCDTVPADGGGREAGDGVCRMNIDSVAPWVISVAATRDDMDGGAGAQGVAFFSSRGDTEPQTTLDGTPGIVYQPTLAAPGVNILSARAPNGSTNVLACGSAELPACQDERPEDIPYYIPLSGTSMASPQVAGAVAVVQSAAKAKLGRYLGPDEVKALLQRSATPLANKDLFWDWPCATPPFPDCGQPFGDMTGQPYAAWHGGAGMLDVARAVDQVAKLPKKAPKPPKRRA